jgi:tight adherence protein C
MDLVVVAGAAAVVGSLLLIWWSVSGNTTDALDLGQTDLQSRDLRERQLSLGASDRLAKPSFDRFGRFLRKWTPAGRLTSMERKLASAGSPAGWSVDRLLTVKVMSGIVLAGLVLLIVELRPLGMMLVVAAGLIGFLIPDALLARKIDARKQRIRGELADVIDQVSMMVQAGLGIDAAIARAARSSDGPIADEFARMGQDVRVGIERSVALANMAERIDVPELRTVVAAIIQAERLGSPISQTLEIQAKDLRLKRRQHAEEQAMKLPVKLLFPMVLCILPVLLIVILAPAAISIFDTLG